MNQLKVYRASAGSGKTFTLAVEFIHLLIINPLNYRNILAVTFTNKATGEMKERIISKLHGLAVDDGSADDYFGALQKLFQQEGVIYPRKKVCENAGKALNLIIHDYSHFRVETIDSFFQSIIRQLARELNLTANLRVDLNQDEALQEAVQNMIDSITEDKETYAAIKSYVWDNLEKGKKWNITEPMTEFSKNIFKEVYLKNKELMKGKTDIKTFSNFKKKLRKRRQKLMDSQVAIGQQFMDLCDQHGFSVDNFFNRSRGIWSFFNKLQQGETPEIKDAILKHLSEHWSKESAVQAMEDQFVPLLQSAIDAIRHNQPILAGINLMLTNLNQTMLLGKVNEKLRQLNDEANRFLLADTAYFLRELIAGNDIPFIYEKAGTQFQYIMIDEFQDTSELQWDNFQPLIANSLSNGNNCLLVGDVKQSIYRWRNSDWSILNDIEHSQFGNYVKQEPLDTNYRSGGNIIDFNNDFFTDVTELLIKQFNMTCNNAEELTEAIRHAYSDVRQKTKDKNVGIGYVEVKLFGNKDKEKDFVNDILAQMSETISELLSSGIRQNDIAILVREKDEAQLVSQYLSDTLPQDTNIISDVAFKLKSSTAVSLIIDILRVLAAPSDRLTRMSMAYKYYKHVGKHDDVSMHQFFAADDETINKLLPPDFVQHEQELTIMPLYELCEHLYSLFRLDSIEGQDAYLFSFFDQLAAFVHDKPATISTFITFWDEELNEASIPSAQTDGIQVITIHKSKGLEFHTVFIPFCTWPIEVSDGHDPLLWCQPHTDEFKDLPLAALKFGNDMRDSEFREEYNNEQLKTFVDNLNIIYVAFTRPSHNMFIYSGRNIKYKKDNTEYSHAYDCFDLLRTWTGDKDHVRGTLCLSDQHKETKKPSIDVGFDCPQRNTEFRQSNKSRDFINGDDDSNRDYYINKGLVIHKIMESITTPDDISRVMLSLDCEGAFPGADFRRDIEQTLHGVFTDNRVKRWFAPEWTVLNEHGIIYTDEDGTTKSRRPDRVITNGTETIVIDYKTGKQSDDHTEQVKTYIELLRQMGYPNVHGYLWYISRNDIVNL